MMRSQEKALDLFGGGRNWRVLNRNGAGHGERKRGGVEMTEINEQCAFVARLCCVRVNQLRYNFAFNGRLSQTTMGGCLQLGARVLGCNASNPV